MDPASFTLVRLASGAITLVALAWLSKFQLRNEGSWFGGLTLFAYAALFSFAYIELETGIGALILFGAVQLTMLAFGLRRGERLNRWQTLGLVMACLGLIALLSPGLESPSWWGAVLMLGAGVSWALYSLLGFNRSNALASTAANFVRTLPLAVPLLFWSDWQGLLGHPGLGYALASGIVASGFGYALWYYIVPKLSVTNASSVQLSVPVLASLGGFVWLGEPLTMRLLICSAITLGGIGLVLWVKNMEPRN